MKFIKDVKSATKPVELDTTSNTTVYVRENIRRVEEKDPIFNTLHVSYIYDEKQYTYQEWISVVTDQVNKSSNNLQDKINTTQLALAETIGMLYGVSAMSLEMDNQENTDFVTTSGEATMPNEVMNDFSAIIKLYGDLIKENLFNIENVPSEFVSEINRYLIENN